MRRTAKTLVVLMAIGGWATVSAQPAPTLEQIRLLVVERINQDRRAAGLRPVEYAPELSRAADPHCQEMLTENFSSHWSRAGWKPYLRYSHAGIRDNTAENIAAYWCTGCTLNPQKLRDEALHAHQRFMDERPPRDGHRKSILDPTHTHVGIGLAYHKNAFRMIELFAGQYVELDELPLRATLGQSLNVRGRVSAKGYRLMSVSVFYEPLPKPMTLQQLNDSYSYSLPQEERIERPSLAGTSRQYADGTLGTVQTDAAGTFQVPLEFWKRRPGVYTVAVWVRRAGEEAFIGASASILVEK